MANYDDIFNASAQKGTEEKSFVSFNKEEWAAQKKQERESAFAMIDETAQRMANDGGIFQSYLDVQARFDRYSVGNAVLITAQKADATQLSDFKGWKNNGVFIKKGESGILPMDIKGEYVPIKRDIKLVDDDTLKFIDSKILRQFGVSLPILTGDYTKDQYEAFYQKTLEPLIISISQAFTKALFGNQKNYGNKIAFYSKELMFMSVSQKLEMVRVLGDSGSLYENEKRVAFGLRPLPELAGVRKQSLNYVDVEIANQYQLQNQKGGKENEGTGNTQV